MVLKILPEAFAADLGWLDSFEREAKVLAFRNHPNIWHIYGLKEVEGQKALADRIAQGAMSGDEALPISAQIADALEAAHEQGIIHRDLEPASSKVKDDCTVKALGFGLAKALRSETADPNMSLSPTISLTAAAVVT